ncbi:preprotein translocase subunit Sec61beta [Natranaeroarchaeum aerophilus]|uniref:Preprotein translocase subunit SecG n=1 Tax=Natranaeroarchaeum aerophilus TaxID=2917711 RepID=A0AAE3K5Y1_9EURY|nr:preprotein translocase subunit Sec61beta [Natranaeroarchaeum aerophilus]MCL9814662.1 preprotein translocase subunit Sec61beta [Natranaeroarchaeum aerophilus]
MSGSSGENSGGLMSSAGLVRYFDAEDSNAIQMDPRTVIVVSVALGIFVHMLGIWAHGISI